MTNRMKSNKHDKKYKAKNKKKTSKKHFTVPYKYTLLKISLCTASQPAFNIFNSTCTIAELSGKKYTKKKKCLKMWEK